jgi:predicted ATP-grasp superfamily ATP-dependent carboligase
VPDASRNLVLVGASVRAAAFSALRAGYQPWCADLFGDADLVSRCPAVRIPGRYPGGLLSVLEQAPRAPLLYTGALENHPALLRELARRRPLLGNGPEVVARVRDPFFLAECARRAGLPAPALQRDTDDRSTGGAGRRWLLKPRLGGGGLGIRFADGEGVRRRTGAFYQQEYIPGCPVGALYLGTGQGAVFLGLSRQLVGEPWLNATGFRYCGSIGPLAVEEPLAGDLTRLGQELCRQSELRGLFGVDGILQGQRFWPVEINPRYTASVEVLEYATGWSALAAHIRVASGQWPVGREEQKNRGSRPLPFRVGKAILYAPRNGSFPPDGPWLDTLRHPQPIEELPRFADIPAPGFPLSAGHPVLTLLARAATEAACLAALVEAAREVQRWLEP